MTAASGDSGENPTGEGGQPVSGGYEAPPIEQLGPGGGYPPPAYGSYPAPPAYPPPVGPGGAGYYAPPPEYGAPYPGGYGYPAEYATGPAKLNVLALVSLVASVLWVCGIGSVVGVVLGAAALNQIKRTRERGYALAVAGIVVGVLGIAAALISITFSPRN